MIAFITISCGIVAFIVWTVFFGSVAVMIGCSELMGQLVKQAVDASASYSCRRMIIAV